MILIEIPKIRRWRKTPPQRHRPAKLFSRFADWTVLSRDIRRDVWVAALAYIVALTLTPGHYGKYFAFGFSLILVLATFMGLVGIVIAAVSRVAMIAADRESNLGPFDELLHVSVPILAQAIELQPIWDRPDVGRFLINRFEDAARTAERTTRIGSRVPLSEPKLRTRAGEDSLRLAAVLRWHKTAVADARTPADYATMLDSFTAGVAAMMREDWRALLANAPEHVRAHPGLTAWAGARLVPALVLGALAVVLPQFAPLQGSAELLRIVLSLYAVITAIPRQDSTLDLVGGLIGKYSK